MFLVASQLRPISTSWKVPPLIQSLLKCCGTLMSLQKLVFFFFFLGKVLTLTQLKKKGFHLAGKCPFCRREEEELEQILIYCPSIWGQWTDLLNAFGVSWTCPFFVKDLLQSWLHFPVRKKAKSIWRAIPLILFWAIWEERNRVIFEDATFSTLRQTLCYPFPFYLGWLYSKR